MAWRGLLRGLKMLMHTFISDSFRIGGNSWIYRVSEGEHGWVASLSTSSGELYDSFNPFAIYAYKAREPGKRHIERYIFAIYPRGCSEPACAIYVSTEANDENLGIMMKKVAEIAPLYYEDPEEFYERLSNMDIYTLQPEEIDEYLENTIKPTPTFGKRISENIEKTVFVKMKRI